MNNQVLVTDNLPGNVHEAAKYINSRDLAAYVLSLNFNGDNYSIVVYRMTVAQRDMFREKGVIPKGRAND